MTQCIKIKHYNKVVLVTLNRPEALNALNDELRNEFLDKVLPLEKNSNTQCIVLTGSEKAFAAGADIKEMSTKNYMENYYNDMLSDWEKFSKMRIPKIAAVNGFALGGGCELAMMCDLIIAGKSAKFGQPEIKLGVIPGMGGSQRLTKIIGKSKAMDMILTGRMMNADEAERSGLVTRVIEDDNLIEEALSMASTIASYGKASVMMARETVDRALELGLTEGLLFEKRLFLSLFSTLDQKEGMKAFMEKRPPKFTGK